MGLLLIGSIFAVLSVMVSITYLEPMLSTEPML